MSVAVKKLVLETGSKVQEIQAPVLVFRMGPISPRKIHCRGNFISGISYRIAVPTVASLSCSPRVPTGRSKKGTIRINLIEGKASKMFLMEAAFGVKSDQTFPS